MSSILDSPLTPAHPSSPSQFRLAAVADDVFSDVDVDDDTRSVSLSSPPRSPRRSDDVLRVVDQPDSGKSVNFFREPEVLFSSPATASDATASPSRPLMEASVVNPIVPYIPDTSHLEGSPVRKPFSNGRTPLGSPIDMKMGPSTPRSPRTPRMSRMSGIFPPSPSVATMPVSRARPDSLPLTYTKGKLILGVIVIDFNHLVGPKVEFAVPPAIGADEELCNLLPFLALPDGAHLSSEDYSYFHIPTSYTGDHQTVFGISCNRQIQSSQLINKSADVTRSTVQKAVVVLASKPIFGPIRDKLGVVTRAFFNQLDFRETDILVDFYSSLETSLSGQLTESALYMGTSLRELVHKFRHKTLTLLKMLMMQKKIMFFGTPVETLCTYQYSLVSLIPGLLDQLEDCASPALDRREHDTERPSELRTSDRASLLRYLGLPINVFGKDAFFQPYLPLQEVDMLKSGSYLCGTTNNIVTQQRDARPDLLVNIETMTFEFVDARMERSVALTAADRKWMDEVVRDVQDTWSAADPSRPSGMQCAPFPSSAPYITSTGLQLTGGARFKGSDDYLRAKFEDYICSMLAAVKYGDFLAKGAKGDVLISGAAPAGSVLTSFGDTWVAGFKATRAGQLWDLTTDPVLFDICEPRHPCEAPPSIASDIGVRLAEGLHDLNLEERMAPAREALSGAWRAVEGVRSDWGARLVKAASPVQNSQKEDGVVDVEAKEKEKRPSGLRQLSLVGNVAAETGKGVGAALGSWGSFFASKAAALAAPAAGGAEDKDKGRNASPSPSPSQSRTSSMLSVTPEPVRRGSRGRS